MGQLDMYAAQSLAAERHRTVARDAEHRRIARERSPQIEEGARHGVLARVLDWLHHPFAHAPVAR